MRRVLPVVEALAKATRCAISIDTSKAAVARAAVERGAGIINDVTCLNGPNRDASMAEVARETGSVVVIMQMQVTPRTIQDAPHYENVAREVADFFRQRFAHAVTCGIHPMNIAFDPGIGFGKTVAHNLLLLKSIESLRVEGRPLVMGVSRKSFLGKIMRLLRRWKTVSWPTVALTALLRERGAEVLRVHDVRANCEALRMTEAILREGGRGCLTTSAGSPRGIGAFGDRDQHPVGVHLLRVLRFISAGHAGRRC